MVGISEGQTILEFLCVEKAGSLEGGRDVDSLPCSIRIIEDIVGRSVGVS